MQRRVWPIWTSLVVMWLWTLYSHRHTGLKSHEMFVLALVSAALIIGAVYPLAGPESRLGSYVRSPLVTVALILLMLLLLLAVHAGPRLGP